MEKIKSYQKLEIGAYIVVFCLAVPSFILAKSIDDTHLQGFLINISATFFGVGFLFFLLNRFFGIEIQKIQSIHNQALTNSS